MKTKFAFQLLLSGCAVMSVELAAGQCVPASAKNTLDINNVSAMMLNGGDMWWDYSNTSHGRYEVPKGSGRMPIYAGAIWIGGYDQGHNLHLAGQMYRNAGNDFWPGPLDTIYDATDASSCSLYNKIWKVSRYKIEEFKHEWALGNVQNGTYTPDPDILSWPGNGDVSKLQARYLAPFVDINGDGKYDPLTGDYPKIKGDQMLWWIFNDRGNIHTETSCSPMGIEVHASAYAYTCPQLPDSEQALNYTTLYHYEIFNRSSLEYDSAYFGIFQDADLGCSSDDFVGCYPEGNYSYAYNGDSLDLDCNGELGYRAHPPILSTVILNGPLADPNDSLDNNNNGVIDEPGETNLMTGYSAFINGAAYPQSDPRTNNCMDWYNYLTSHWQNSSPFTHGGTGYGGLKVTRFMFPSFPYDTGWSEVTVPDAPGDRRSLISSGPFTMLPGAKLEYDFAVVYSRDTILPWLSKASFDKNQRDTRKIQQWFANDNFPSCLNLDLSAQEVDRNSSQLPIYPNPASDLIMITYSPQGRNLQFEIVDVMGRQIPHLQLKNIVSAQWQIGISELPPGIYVLRIIDGDKLITKRFVKE